MVQSLVIENGGTSVSVPAIAAATADTGRYRNSLLHFSPAAAKIPRESESLTVLQEPCRSLELLLPTRARICLKKTVQKMDVLQVHGLWTGHSAATLRFARKFRTPVIVSAHGMLDGWALRNKWWKKLPYSILVERPRLTRATCLRALTRIEADNYRAFGLNLPVAVVPNGMTAPPPVSSREFLALHPELEGKKILLFLGRLHRKKGVDLLLKAWNSVSVRLPDAHLVIAGPDDGPLGARLRESLSTSGSNSVTICEMLAGSLKWSALAAASVFVLPSFSEGLSMAILEALCLGLPVLITRECNFREIDDLECTFLVRPTVSSIAEGLVDVLSRSSDELRTRGQVGVKFVKERYLWPLVGECMADVYDWMRGGPVPSSVEIR